jgi:hypothetical protein
MWYIVILAIMVIFIFKYAYVKPLSGFDNETYILNQRDWRSQYGDNLKYKKDFPIGIVGESFENRQDIIKHCKAGDRCYLVHEKSNKYDSNAVAVMHQSGHKIGYIAKQTNEHFVYDLNNGVMIDAVIKSINGEYPNLGVVLHVTLYE